MKKMCLVGLIAIASANATLTPHLLVSSAAGPYCTPAGAACTYEYKATLPADHFLIAGDFFTIYDFDGFAGNIMSPTDWVGTPSLLGRTPTNPSATPNSDSSDIFSGVNITWEYQGATTTPGVNVTYTGFKADSFFNGVAAGEYSGQTRNTGVTVFGAPDSNVGAVDIPGPGGGDTTVPEPMSMALFGGGLTALGLLRLRKK